MRRHPEGPILTRCDIPDIAPLVVDPTSVFNPGALRTGGRTELLLRVQTRGRETVLMQAVSEDGVRFTVLPRIVEVRGLPGGIHHLYDARVSLIEGVIHVVFAADTDEACRLAIARGRDLDHLELVAFPDGDVRNGVLFPERIGGRYCMLRRPNETSLEGGPRSGSRIVLSASSDLVTWEDEGEVIRGRPRSWDELVGSGPPPVKTTEGWLHIYHGVATHFGSVNIYQAGAVLLNLADPTVVIGRTRRNLIEPRETWEVSGQVPNVIFPTGMTVEDDSMLGFAAPESRVRIYYGAADTSVGLAETTVGELLHACLHD